MARAKYNEVDLCERTFQGQRAKIRVDSDGMFKASFGGEFVKDPSFEVVLRKLQRIAKKQRVTVAVPATIVGLGHYSAGSHFHRKYLGMTCVDIVITGINPSTNEPQFRNADGTAFEADRYANHRSAMSLRLHNYDFKRRMTAAEQAEWLRLYEAKRAADAAFNKYDGSFDLKVGAVVKAAIDAVVDDPKEAAADDDGDPR